MTNDNALRANSTLMLDTPEKRLEWFCEHFDVVRPDLAYDPDEPGALLLTDELIAFCNEQGMSLDWFFLGEVAGALSTYRDKYKSTSQTEQWRDAIGKLDDVETKLLLAGLELVGREGADCDQVMAMVSDQIAEHRAGA